MYHPTGNSYFSGAGLLDYALLTQGVEIQQSLELDALCCKSLQANFRHAVLHQDISRQEVLSQPVCDVMVGTYPCNKYSAIGDIHGVRTGNDLFLHYMRHIVLLQPEMYVVENVVGMKKFKVVMEAMSKIPGYYVTIFCPVDSSLWGPQKRLRLILFATRKPFAPIKPEARKRTRLRDIIEPSPWVKISPSVLKRINGEYRDKPIISDPAKDDIAPCAVAHYAKDKGTRLVVDPSHPNGIRPYTVTEYQRLMGLPDSFKLCGTDSQKYRQLGNGVEYNTGLWIGQNIMKYFNYQTRSHTKSQTHQ